MFLLFGVLVAAFTPNINLSNNDLMDTTYHKSMPKNFRKIPDLRISGSGQFSVEQLKKIKNIISCKYQIFVVDLRQEPHAFIFGPHTNGIPITWYSYNNWGIRDSSSKEAACWELKKIKNFKLGIHNVYRVDGKDYKDFTMHISSIRRSINALKSEKEAVESLGMKYQRFYFIDHISPIIKDNAEVDEFINFVRGLPENAWLHFHCAAGKGRTSSFMIMYHMLMHPELSLDEIIDYQAKFGGLDFHKFSKAWKQESYSERVNFFKKFKKYIDAEDGYNANIAWAKWQTAHP